MDKESLLHIYPFNILAKIPRMSSNKQPAVLKYICHTKFRIIFRLSLPDLSINCSDFFNCIPHLLYAKLTELGAEYLATRVLKANKISEVGQYDFNTEDLTVTPKHVNLPCKEEYLIGITGLESISNPFKMVNISANIHIRYIVSVSSMQAKKK